MKLCYGVFLNRRVYRGDDWDEMPIGAHCAIRRMERDVAKSAGFEYYYKFNDKTFIINNPSLAERAVAVVTRTTGKRVVGYRSEAIVVEDMRELKEIINKMKSKTEKSL